MNKQLLMILGILIFTLIVCGTVSATTPTLNEALDNKQLNFTTSHFSGSWNGETTDTHDGVDAATCYTCNDGSEHLYTVVNGPGTLKFYWKYSGYGSLSLADSNSSSTYHVDANSPRATTCWSQVTYNVGSGTHYLHWCISSGPCNPLDPYPKSTGETYGYIDQVEWIPVDTTAPTVTSTNPINGATNVVASKTITVTFNEAVKKGSNFWVELKNSGGTAIAFNSSFSGKVLIIDPKSNLAESLYTLIIHTGAVTDLAGNPAAAKTIKFSVGTPPKVIATTPTNYKTGYSRTGYIIIKFSENIYASTYYGKITVKNLSTGKTTIITKAISGNTLYIKNTTARTAYTWYQVTIPAYAFKDKAGNIQTTAYTFKFKTGAK